MYQEKGFKTIFDDVKPIKIENGNIPEDEIVKPKSSFHINNDKFDSSLIVNDYKMPTFKFIHDDSLNDYFGFPDISLAQNPIYKYKYPKLSTGETIKQQWQTEVGTPNELNTFMRHDALHESIQDIQQSDNAFQAGLNELQKIIDEDTKKIKNAYNNAKDETKKEQIRGIQERRNKETKDADIGVRAFNQVLLNKVYKTTNNTIPTEKEARILIRKVFDEGLKDNPDTKLLKQLTTEPIKKPITKPTSRPLRQNLKEQKPPKFTTKNKDIYNKRKPEPITLIQSEPATQPATQPAVKPIASRKKGGGEVVVNESKASDYAEEGGYESDATEVIRQTVTVADEIKPFYVKAQKY